MAISEFINRFYIRPVIEGTGYNIFNTVTYAAILIIAVFLLLKLIRKMDIGLDRSLWINLLPFVFLGGVTRALEDVGFFSFLGTWNYLFVTPLIYIIIFLTAFIPLIVINWFDLRDRYLGYFGSFLLAIFSIFVALESVRVGFFFLALGIAISGCFITYLILVKYGLNRFRNIMNWSPIFAHSLDASASYTAIALVGGYTEQHVLPSAIFGALPVFIFIPIKLALAAGVVFFIDSELEGKWCWMLKFTVLVLGLGPGTRNLLTMLMGT